MLIRLRRCAVLIGSLVLSGSFQQEVFAQNVDLKKEAEGTMRTASSYYRDNVASHGGYVYFYSADLTQRWGEGVATRDQVWVQPPGTPTVGLAFLKAYDATGDKFYLDAATSAAEALVYGQMKSGGWTNCIDFDPRGERVAMYRNGKGRGRNTSSLDDGQTQSAIRLLINVDRAHQFRHRKIHDAALFALAALLKAQFENGAFPQVWDDYVAESDSKSLRGNFPKHDWRTEGRIKNYWNMYTLNDNVTGYVTDTLIDAHQIYKDNRYLKALKKLGDFLIIAQMPEPQPGWAQQYNYDMQPIWARRFEPPGVSGDESQEVVETLMRIAAATGDQKYLEPIPTAIMYLQRSLLKDGQLARYYELETNKPLYMVRKGKNYTLTHDDSNLPKHYGWKTAARLDELRERYSRAKTGIAEEPLLVTEPEIKKIIADLDQQGRWVSTYNGDRLVGQAKMPVGAKYLSSERFSDSLTKLSRFLSLKRK